MNTASLIKLWNLTQRHPGTSGAKAAVGVLLGLYNGRRFPCDLTDLKLLDQAHHDAAVEVIRDWTAPFTAEVHDELNQLTGRTDFGPRFEHLAHDWKCKGKCKREGLVELEPANLLIATEATPTYSRGPANIPRKVLEFCDEPVAGGICTLGRNHESACVDEDQPHDS